MLNPDKNGYLYAYIGKVEKEPNNNFVIFKSKYKIYLNPNDKYDLKWDKNVKSANYSNFDTKYQNGIKLNGTTYDNCIGNYILLFAGSHIKKTPDEEVKYMVEDNSVFYYSTLLLDDDNFFINNWGDELSGDDWYDDKNPKQNRDTCALVNAIKSCPCYQCNEIIQRIKAYRNYDDDFIKNVLICIAQNFITVFAGQPGTGKTSLCDIISGVLGLDKPISHYHDDDDDDFDINRYISVSVERGWNSKSELIGYYNAIGRKYEDSGSGLYHALKLLNNEKASDAAYPFFVLLDEANLSPVEHYWSAFMKLADESQLYDEGIRGEINIGDGQMYYVPDQLRFLATINNDQTTEPLSPRLLDRTSVIKLPETANKPNPNAGYAPYYISWNRFKYLFSPVNDTEILYDITIAGNSVSISEIMNIIYGMFKAANISISKRVKNRIARYINSACFLGMPPEKAINYAVAQNLLPKINGFYEDFKIRGEDNTNSKHLFTELKGLLEKIENNKPISLDDYKDYLEESGAKQNATQDALEAFKEAKENNEYISYLSL